MAKVKSIIDKAKVDAAAAAIRAFYGRATSAHVANGTAWYPLAGRIIAAIADTYGIDPHAVAAAMAALSPRNPWNWNVADCANLAAYVRNGGTLPKVTTFNSNRDNAIEFLNGSHDWRGTALKVRSFVANMTGDLSEVTVDVWAVRVATDGARDAVTSDGDYANLREGYRVVAAELGMAPATLQAIVWLVAKDDPRWLRNSRHADTVKRGTPEFVAAMLAA